MPIKIYKVDAFTSIPYQGNPAAICVLDNPVEDQWMQAVASEMNLAETAYLLKEGDSFRLRWFTPTVEMDICGHATLASAHILWEQGYVLKGSAINFKTLSGEITVTQFGNEIVMDFPADPESTVPLTEDLTMILKESLGANPIYVGKSQRDFLVEVESAEILRSMTPNMSILAEVPMRGYIVTAKSDKPEFDFISRCFFPAVGIPEDHVTGSAHCCLARYWGGKLDKTEMLGFQASNRGGQVRVKIVGDRVMLIGSCVTVLIGELLS